MNQTAPEDTPPLPPPGKLLASAEIISLADHAAKRAAKLGTVIDGLEAGIASRGEDAAKSAAAAGFPPEDQASAARKVAAKARGEVARQQRRHTLELHQRSEPPPPTRSR